MNKESENKKKCKSFRLKNTCKYKTCTSSVRILFVKLKIMSCNGFSQHLDQALNENNIHITIQVKTLHAQSQACSCPVVTWQQIG